MVLAEAPVVQTAQFGPQGMHIRPKSPTQYGLGCRERWGEEKFITWKPLQCSCAMGIGTHGAAIFTSSCGCEILPVLAFSTSDPTRIVTKNAHHESHIRHGFSIIFVYGVHRKSTSG